MKKLIIIAASMFALAATGVYAKPKPDTATTPATTAAPAKAAPKYDCTKKGNANKAACKAVAVTAPAATSTDAPAGPVKEKASPKYDCTKKGNANKAACKASAATAPAAATAPPPPAPAAKPSAAPAAPAATSATTSAGAHPVCKKGKPCGNSCIAVNKTCHKP